MDMDCGDIKRASNSLLSPLRKKHAQENVQRAHFPVQFQYLNVFGEKRTIDGFDFRMVRPSYQYSNTNHYLVDAKPQKCQKCNHIQDSVDTNMDPADSGERDNESRQATNKSTIKTNKKAYAMMRGLPPPRSTLGPPTTPQNI